MLRRFPKSRLLSLLATVLCVAGLVGAAALARSPHRTASTTVRPRALPTTLSAAISPSPSPSVTTAPSNQPAVAGASTTAPLPPATTPRAATPPTPAPTPTGDFVNLILIDPAGTFSYRVQLLSGADACTILTEAKAEGKITSVNLDYSYMSSLHSAYVREINGYENNWTVKVNSSSPQGCSLVSPKNNDNVTWRYQ